MTKYAQNGGLTRFDTGSNHENNPLGGIPIGNNNSVEENETKQNNFVYSNRIFLDSNIVSQYNLPKSLIGKSVADATKFIDNKFKGRNDKISQSTKNGMLSKIAEAQEAMKPQEPEMVPQDGMMEQSPEMMEDPSQMALGGYTKRFGGGGFAQYDTFDPNAGVGYKFNPKSISTPTINTSDLSLSKESTTTTPDSKINMNTVGSVGMGVGTALSQVPSDALDKKYSFNSKLKAQDDSMEKVKQGVAAAVPIAGLFYGIEKAGLAAGEAIGGEKGRDVATGILDPSSGQREVLQSKDSSQFEKGLSLAAPFISGILAGKARNRTEIKAKNQNALTYNKQFSDQYALGGEILNPIDPIKVLATKQGILSSPVNENPLFNTKRIVKHQPGVTNDKLGRGFYLYSKDNTQPGFNPNRDREFIKQSEMLAVQRTPEWKEYVRNQSIQPKQFAMGGNIKKYEDGGYYDKNNPYFMTNPGPVNMGPNPAPTESILQQGGLKPIGTTVPYTIATQPKVDISNANRRFAPGPSDLDMLKYNAGKIGNYINQNAGNIARYAPIAANALQLAQLKKPQGERLDRLGNRYKPEYVDEAMMRNIVDQEANNQINALTQSGASQGAVRNAILGAGLNKTKALSDAYMNAAAQNRATNDRAQTFNLGVDQVNLQQSNTEKENFARDQAAYRNAKREYITGIGEGIGDIGKEQVQKKIIAKTTGYKWDGEYVKSPDGTVVTDPTTGKPMTEEKLKEIQSIKDKKALGGYLIKNKRQ